MRYQVLSFGCMQQVQVNLRLYESQLAAVDEVRGDVPRNAWLRRVVVDALEAARGPVAEREGVRPRRRLGRVQGAAEVAARVDAEVAAERGDPIPGQVDIDGDVAA